MKRKKFILEFVEFYPNLSTIKKYYLLLLFFSPLEKQFSNGLKNNNNK
jgi:hypothetical protein